MVISRQNSKFSNILQIWLCVHATTKTMFYIEKFQFFLRFGPFHKETIIAALLKREMLFTAPFVSDELFS